MIWGLAILAVPIRPSRAARSGGSLESPGSKDNDELGDPFQDVKREGMVVRDGANRQPYV
jgi:hypothetical protein